MATTRAQTAGQGGGPALSLRQIEVFHAVVLARSITSASKVLNVRDFGPAESQTAAFRQCQETDRDPAQQARRGRKRLRSPCFEGMTGR
ncbi:hypothetical protein [Mesorhizobium sp. L-8-3]|uniref:hypothetical protein n=1 Tax=Mesorhizobium sp. L-8-3 TaxID=2744522 RepID=UPI00192959A1|nr:hypothetical protein [Mesorhizobium sp. L-8-3]